MPRLISWVALTLVVGLAACSEPVSVGDNAGPDASTCLETQGDPLNPAPPPKTYKPDDPNADAQGFVTQPNVNRVVELAGEVALKPMPRLAKAAHSWLRLAPPVSTWSAWRMASRACRKFGFAGDRFIPSVTNCSMN